MSMSGKRFRGVVSFLLPLIAAALCAAQAFPSAGAMRRDAVRAGHATAGAVSAAQSVAQSVAANKAADAAAIVADDWSNLFSKPSSPGAKAAAAIMDTAPTPALHAAGPHRPLPAIGLRSAASSQAYLSQAPPASLALA
jgi:hypothetical protein